MKLVLGDLGFGFRNIDDLMSPILAARMVGVSREICAATATRFREDRDHQLGLFGGYQISVASFVARLPAGLALLGFHGRPSLRFGSRSVR
jgi:hypothetical protein